MKIIKLLIVVFIALSCNNRIKNEVKIDQKGIEYLSKNYSKQCLDYFYELAFFDESLHKEITLKKWKKNIQFYVTGNVSSTDLKYINNSIQKLNDLKLPISFSLTINRTEANVEIFFGSRDKITELGVIPQAQGMAETKSENGIIYKGRIIILNDNAPPKKREALILEEMSQIIGSITDSFSHPESVFYQGENSSVNFSSLDRETMSLLYDSLMPVNYTLSQYELDFQKLLNYSKANQKLQDSIIKKSYKKDVLEIIEQSCFIEGVFYKHPNYVPVYLENFKKSDSICIQGAVTSINKLSKNLFLQISTYTEDSPRSGIFISLKENNTLETDTQTSISNGKGEVFKPKRYESIVAIDFRKSINSTKKNKVIIKALFKALGPTYMESFDENWVTYEDNSVNFTDKYADVIKLIYSSEFVDGLTKKDFSSITNSIYK